jgi:hypothetical protein
MIESPSVQIEVAAQTTLSYAMAHNRVPVITMLSLHNSGPQHMGTVVQVEVDDGEGVVSRPCRVLVDLAENDSMTLRDVGLQLDPGPMLQIDEQRPGKITLTVEHEGETLGETLVDVQLLAARHWLANPRGLALELLASFVMPNDPAITALMQETSANLVRRTGSPSIEGYQSGVDRVDEIVRSICEAMQARVIRYSTPPASWADDGQKVRSPSEVLEGRVGTCLDTVLTLAAALEQSSIRPVLWIVDGHAFLGYWREEFALDATVDPSPLDVVNRIDLGQMRLVETTMLTARPEPVTFHELHRPPYDKYLQSGLDQVIGVVDIWRARQNGIVPLPARRRSEDGVQVFEYKPAVHSSPTRIVVRAGARDDASQATADDTVPVRIQQWKNALLDLSLRNRLINFSERSSIRLVVPDEQLGTIEDIINAEDPLGLVPSDQFDYIHGGRGVESGASLPKEILSEMLAQKSSVFCDIPRSSYPSRMRALAYKARTIVEETGANNLYLALGSLIWSIDSRTLRSPLILVPIRLVSVLRSHLYRIELDDSGASTPNYCLLEKLKQTYKLEIPGLSQPVEDASGIDLDAALNATRVAIRDRGLSFRVEPTADVAILQFAKFRLWKDLDENWTQLMSNSLVTHLVESPTDPFEDPVPVPESVDLDELDASCPVPADASQLDAVALACAGRTFVLEGPPGTGKSQTITNLLTRAVAEGKKVLFVAEKRAALDVVSARLAAVGMGPFSLDLHDKASKPTVVRAQIKAALDHSVGVDDQGLAAQRESLRAACRNLLRYAQRLHERNGAGLSYYSARTSLLALGEDGDHLPIPPSLLLTSSGDALRQARALLVDLPDVAYPARPSANHPWGFVGHIASDDTSLAALRTAAIHVDDAVRSLPQSGSLYDVLGTARSAEEVKVLAAFATDERVPLDVLDMTRTASWRGTSAALSADVSEFAAASHPGLDVATPSVLDLPIAAIHTQAQAAAASGFFGRGKRLKAVLTQLTPALRPGVEIKPKRVPELTSALMQVKGAVVTMSSRASAVAGVRVPADWNPLMSGGPELVHHQIAWLTWAGAAVEQTHTATAPSPFVGAIRRYLEAAPVCDPAEAQAVQRMAHAMAELARCSGGEGSTVESWASDGGFLDRWVSTSAGRGLDDGSMIAVRRLMEFLAALEPIRAVGLTEAHEALRTGVVHADAAVRAFDRGLAVASIAERRTSTGLDAFDPQVHDKTVRRFTDSASAVRRQMTTALPQEVLNRRPFKVSAGRGQVGALQRELAKQRRGLGVRGMLQTYGKLITQVMPCVLVSPDSVSRFFPVGSQVFDIVVFDEASQIRVADAIGAMGRSRSVVVVGDSKQMPPTSFAEPHAGADDEPAQDTLVVEDEESILTESVLARVPQRWLTWHYRSQDESLISFSNRHYYDDKLSSFPAPHADASDRDTNGYGVSLVRVDGAFLRTEKGRLFRTNPVEADAIVAEMEGRFAASLDAAPSIGVVTFNQQQRAHIEGLIRDSNDERLIEALDGTNGEGLFIKNLENVQGDERDVILFSTAFSVNEKGVLPLNFGPLNQGGGERRLNVAVTRARRQVLVFSSFDPAQLRAEETQSVGIKHLRAYLDMAALGAGALGASPHQKSQAPDRHRDEIASALRKRGLVVNSDVGLSDFKIDLTIARPEDPDQPLVAVLLDGEGWYERRTVGDRDGLPVYVLARLLGWPAVERVWLPEWLVQSNSVLDRLETATREAVVPALVAVPTRVELAPNLPPSPPQAPMPHPANLDLGPREPQVATSAPARVFAGVASPAPPQRPAVRALPGGTPFVAWPIRRLGGRDVLDSLPSPSATHQVQAALELIVKAEGPIHVDRLARLIASAFDLSRVSPARMESILAHLPRHYRRDKSEPFAWPDDIDPAQWTGFRHAPELEPRSVEDISLREIGNAMVALCRDSAGMFREELFRETLAVFGGRRLTPGISARLQPALSDAMARGMLSLSSSGLVTAGPADV